MRQLRGHLANRPELSSTTLLALQQPRGVHSLSNSPTKLLAQGRVLRVIATGGIIGQKCERA
jgi:hypothetical protein